MSSAAPVTAGEQAGGVTGGGHGRPWWRWFAAAGLALVAVYAFLPPGAQGAVTVGLNVATVVAIVVGVRLHRPERRDGWVLLALGWSLSAAAIVYWLPYNVDPATPVPFPTLADVVFLGAYPLLAVGLLRLTRAEGRRAWLDTLIVFFGAGAVVWLAAVAPVLGRPGLSSVEQVATAAYPIADLILLAVVAHVLFSGATESTAYRLLLGAIVVLLAGDAVWIAVSVDGAYVLGGVPDLAWLAAYVATGSAALHPSMRRVVVIDDEERYSVGRLGVLLVAALVAPVGHVVYDARIGDPVGAVAGTISAVLFVLVFLRAVGLVRRVAERERADEEAARRAAIDRMLLVAAATANEAEGLDEALGTLMRDWSRTTGRPVGRAFTIEDDEVATVHWYGTDRRGVGALVDALDDTSEVASGPIARRALEARAAVWIEDLAAEADPPLVAALRRAGLVSGGGIPVIVRGEPVAVVETYTGERTARDEAYVGVETHLAAELARVHEREVARRELESLALRDELTGLGNRTLLLDRLDRVRARAERGDAEPSLVIVDLDGFKAVNDTFGHAVGDELLRSVADRITAATRESDVVARLGGDEFGVVVEDGGPQTALGVAHRVRNALEGMVALESREFYVQASLGIASIEPGQSVQDVLRHADAAMYHAKEIGTGEPQVFVDSTHAPVLLRLALAADLRRAIARDELSLAYQPIVDLRDNRIVAVEALARWRTPERGSISPGDFIPIAEQSGTIHDLGSWVLRTACEQLWRWREVRPDDTPMLAVNVSGAQFRDRAFVDSVRTLLDRAAVPSAALTLEVTESALVGDLDHAIGVLRSLDELGVGLAIDDFGTGYSSLSYLKDLPVDTVKIDRSFVAGITRASGEWSLALAIVKLISALGLTTVAEGVEQGSQLAHLRALGADQAQGYYFARPMPADEILELVREGHIDVSKARDADVEGPTTR